MKHIISISLISAAVVFMAGCTSSTATTATDSITNTVANTNIPTLNTNSRNATSYDIAAGADRSFSAGVLLPVTDTSDFTTTASGLQYKDVTPGSTTDTTAAQAGDHVVMDYVGTLPDGTKFDSSLDRGTPFTFTIGVGQVIKGWDEGVAGMTTGQERILIIPANLGYGAAGTGGGAIPPNATLQFEVRLDAIQ